MWKPERDEDSQERSRNALRKRNMTAILPWLYGKALLHSGASIRQLEDKGKQRLAHRWRMESEGYGLGDERTEVNTLD